MDLSFSIILKEYLKAEGMKQKDFAEVIEEPQYIVSDWINGRAKPGYESLKKMATKLNISADYLLGIIDTY